MASGKRSVSTVTSWLVGAMGLMLVGVASAGAQTVHHASNVRPPADAPAQPLITLERTGCKGQCAEYKLEFFDDGQVVYDGLANVSKAGRWYGHLPRETVERLVLEFRRIGYDSLATNYPPGIMPSPLATVSLRANGKVKVVAHEQNSPFPPASLSVLEDRIDTSVQSIDWAR